MTWEYKVVQFHWNDSVEGAMNNLGMQGWELVTCEIIEGFYKCVFKKQRGG